MGLRTSRRITLTVAVVSVLLLIVGVSGAWYVHRLQASSSQLLDVNVASIRAAEELELHLREFRYELNGYRMTGDSARLKAALAKQDEVERWLNEAERLATTATEQELMAGLRRGWNRVIRELNEIAKSDDREAANLAVGNLVQDVLSDVVIDSARSYLDFNESELERSNRENQEMSGRLALALLLLGSCGAIAGLVAGYGVARGVRRTILQLTVPIRDVAGKLSEVVGPVTVSGNPGIDDLQPVLEALSINVATVVERLHESHREMTRADQLAALGQLAAGLAHELRNPLMCMKVLVQAARRQASPELDGRDLAVLDEEICRLENLLEGFLDFARPATLDTSSLDLRSTIAQTIELMAPKARQRGVEVAVQIPADPVIVDADPPQLRQLLLNLLLNALDAIGMDGRIDVSLIGMAADDNHANRRAGGSWVLTVADDGAGLPPHRDRLFEPFFSTKETGLGLGLATCRRIADLHGGEIIARDRPSGGAEFIVRLPMLSRSELEPVGRALAVAAP